MKQSDLITTVAAHSLHSKTIVTAVLVSLATVAQSALAAGDDVPLPGLGALKTAKREAREGRNPLTGAKLKIAAKTVPKFTASKVLKDAVNTTKKPARAKAK